MPEGPALRRWPSELGFQGFPCLLFTYWCAPPGALLASAYGIRSARDYSARAWAQQPWRGWMDYRTACGRRSRQSASAPTTSRRAYNGHIASAWARTGVE
jgi:hypothetical protein